MRQKDLCRILLFMRHNIQNVYYVCLLCATIHIAMRLCWISRGQFVIRIFEQRNVSGRIQNEEHIYDKI